MHVPTLPSKPSWETPIAASREIVEAISDAADSAVDVATSAVRSARRRRTGRRSLRSLRLSWRWIAAALIVVGAAVAVKRRRASASATSGSAAERHAVDPDGIGRSEPARSDGRIEEYGDDVLADAGTGNGRPSVAE